LAIPTDPRRTLTIIPPSTQPQKIQQPRKPKRKDTQVFDLEKITTTQRNKISSLKRRVKKLEKKNRSRTHRLKRLYKVGSTARVESFGNEERLDGEEVFVVEHEVAIKRVNDEVNVVEEVVEFINTAKLIIYVAKDSTVGDIDSIARVATTVSAATTTTATITTVSDITLAQALEEIKSTNPKEKGIIIHELGKSTTTKSSQQLQDNGEGILIEPMIEPVKPMKRKDQIRLDEEVALNLQAEFDEEERLVREKVEKVEEANIALIETQNDIHAKIDVDYQLAKRIQAQEQEELSIAEKATIFQQLLKKRRKHFAAKKMFDRAFKRVNTFEDFRTELVKGKEKRAGTKLIQEITKKQKVEDNKETTELKEFMEIIPNEEEVAINAISLSVKSPNIVD
nr:hypothetical protein [Tanacetum cinerariifolium]